MPMWNILCYTLMESTVTSMEYAVIDLDGISCDIPINQQDLLNELLG